MIKKKKEKIFQSLAEKYKQRQGTVNALAKEGGVSLSGFYNYLKKEGIHIRENKGGRAKKNPYEEMAAKWVTGEYTISELAKEYGTSLSGFSEYLKKNRVSNDGEAKEALDLIDRGFKLLASIMKGEHKKEASMQAQPPANVSHKTKVPAGLDKYKKTSDAIVELVCEKNPLFAKTMQEVTSKLLKVCINYEDHTLRPGDVKNITSSMRDINDIFGSIPKIDKTAATQINIMNQNQNINQNNINNNQNHYEVRVNVVKQKEDVKKRINEIIDIVKKDE